MEEQEEVLNQDVNPNEEHFDDESNPVLDNLEQILEIETPKIEEKPTEEVVDDKTEVVEEAVVDDALILLYPTLAGLKGKPISEVVKSYDNLSREYTKLSQKPKKDKIIEIETPAETEEVPYVDSYDNPDGHEKWLKAQFAKIGKSETEDVSKLVDAKLEDAKKLEIEQHKADKEQAATMKAKSELFQKETKEGLVKVLPEGIDPDEAIQFYAKENANTVLKDGKWREELAEMWVKNPEHFVKTVADYTILALQSNKTQADIRSEAFNTVKDGLSKKTTGALSQSTVQRQNFEVDENQKLVDQIYEITVAPPD